MEGFHTGCALPQFWWWPPSWARHVMDGCWEQVIALGKGSQDLTNFILTLTSLGTQPAASWITFQSGRRQVTMAAFPQSSSRATTRRASSCAADPLARSSDSSVATTTRGAAAGQQTNGLHPYSIQKTTKFA